MVGSIVWIRDDLRLDDNEALAAAAALREPVAVVYIWSPKDCGKWAPGAASMWYLHHALKAFDNSLRRAGNRLIVRKGNSSQVLRQLVSETHASRVMWNASTHFWQTVTDEKVRRSLEKEGIHTSQLTSSSLVAPHTVHNGNGEPYKVFTSFYNRAREFPVSTPVAAPTKISSFKKHLDSLTVEDLHLLPRIPWDTGLRETWEAGEAHAREAFDRFCDRQIGTYPLDRNVPSEDGTSRLSPSLHFGEISARRMYHQLTSASRKTKVSEPISVFIRQLYWREFAAYTLQNFPESADEPLRPQFESMPWIEDEESLHAWQHGKTGFPIVDAAMRQLWRTGWMHNRARMIVGSFLCKDLLIPWQRGAEWFWDTLVDADLPNNTMGWQWISGAGIDAAPYFRIFNPERQSEQYDPKGEYIRRWVPELAALPNKYIHSPGQLSAEELRKYGVVLGQNYPYPIVNHDIARKRALAAFAQMKTRHGKR